MQPIVFDESKDRRLIGERMIHKNLLVPMAIWRALANEGRIRSGLVHGHSTHPRRARRWLRRRNCRGRFSASVLPLDWFTIGLI